MVFFFFDCAGYCASFLSFNHVLIIYNIGPLSMERKYLYRTVSIDYTSRFREIGERERERGGRANNIGRMQC